MCRVPPAITGPRQGRLAATAAGLPRPRGLGLSWRDLELPPRLRWWGLCSSATTSHRAVHEFCPITGRDGWDDFFGTKQVGAEGGALLALQVTPDLTRLVGPVTEKMPFYLQAPGAQGLAGPINPK